MKKITLLCAMLCFMAMSAQVTNEGTPLSWEMSSRSATSPVIMPALDYIAINAEDAANEAKGGQAWRFGIEHQVDLGLDSAGVWDVLPNGDRIWRLNIVSTGAKTMNFVFNKYKIPSGGSLYLYSDDRSSLLGAYTNLLNREDMMLGTWTVDGDNIWLEYHEPKAVIGEGVLNLSKVIHGYRLAEQMQTELNTKALNDSGICNHDVDCPVGADWDPFKEDLKRSVAFLIMDGFICSGALINNVNNDRAPYFLTANHCNAGSGATWAYRFNWRSPDPDCGTAAPSTTNAPNTTSGSTLLATNSQSDFRLMRIDGAIPDSWNLVWAGWNRSSTAVPDYTVGIHHPNGDIMKVCRDNDSPVKGIQSGRQVWFIDGLGGSGSGGGWEIGVTEGGSSGSPLFNEDGHIVGQLFGGAAACAGTNDNNAFDYYGRFDQAWDTGASAANSLQPWLDPDETGGETLETLSTNDYQFEANLSIFPNPASTLLNVVNFGGTDLDYVVYSMLGQVIKRGTFSAVNNEINVSDYTEGIYFVKIIDNENNASITKKIVVRH